MNPGALCTAGGHGGRWQGQGAPFQCGGAGSGLVGGPWERSAAFLPVALGLAELLAVA